MTFKNIENRVSEYYKKNQTITALYWVLKKYKMKTSNLEGFIFRESAKPEFILLTTEGEFNVSQKIRIPQNLFEFQLDLIITLLAHELIHVRQKTIKPFVLDKNEREFQAYYEMNFHTHFPLVPEISDYHKKFFAQRGLDYYNKMGENSELQNKYVNQMKEMKNLIEKLTL